MDLLEFEKTWKEYKLVRSDGQSKPLVKIFPLEEDENINNAYYRGGLVLIQDLFMFKIKHALKATTKKDGKVFLERLTSVGRGQAVWEVVGELVKLSEIELESFPPKADQPLAEKV